MLSLFAGLQSDTEYHGDHTVITKNSSVIVKRVPAQRSKTLRIEASVGHA
jgi:hypothetical protein